MPHTHEELDAAEHQEELPASIRSTVSIMSAVRGVCGPDSGGVTKIIDGKKNQELEFCIYL